MQIQILHALEMDLRERLSLGQPASVALELSCAALYTQSLKLILSALLQPEEYTPRLSAFRWTLLAGSDQYVDTGFNVSLVGGTGGTPASSGVDLLDFQKDTCPTPKSQHSPSKGYRREQLIGIKAPGNRP